MHTAFRAALAIGATALLLIPAAAPAASLQREAAAAREHVADTNALQAVRSGSADLTAATEAPTCEPHPTVEIRTNGAGYLEPECSPYVEGDYPGLRVTDKPDHAYIDVWVDYGYAIIVPHKDFVGTDTLKFVAFNSAGDSVEHTVTINVTADRNSAPICPSIDGRMYGSDGDEMRRLIARKGETRIGGGWCIDYDQDAVSLEIVDGPDHGSLTFSSTPDRYIQTHYTPSGDAAVDTLDTATVRVKDARGATSSETYEIGWKIVAADYNTAPYCYGSPPNPEYWPTAEIGEDNDVYGGCVDAENDAVTLSTVAAPAHADVAYEDGRVIVRPRSGATGEDQLQYRGTDAKGAAGDPATVDFRYAPANAEPSCTVAPVAVAHGTRTEFSFPCSDPDSAWLDVYAYSASHDNLRVAAHGDMEIRAVKDGAARFAYTPDAGFSGADGFLVEIYSDGDAVERKVELNVAAASGGSPPSSDQGGTPPPPAGPTAEQVFAAMTAFLNGETLEFLQEIAKQNKKGIDPKKAQITLGTVGVEQLPNGGTVDIGVYDKPGAKAARASAKKRKLLGSTKVTVAKGQSRKLKVKLNKKGKALLRKKGKVKFTVDMTIKDALTGATVKQSKTVAFKVKRKRRR